MSDAHNDQAESHEGPIKTPKQLIIAVFLGFVVPIAVIVMLAMYVTTENRPAAGSGMLEREAIATRLQAEGRVEIKDGSEVAVVHTGEQVFNGQCTACHTSGAAGAPKIGDAEAWAPRIKTGFDALWHSALKGKNAMPPQGGGEFSDYEVGRAVVYMANKGGAKFEDPPAPAAAASAPAAATASDGASAPASEPAK